MKSKACSRYSNLETILLFLVFSFGNYKGGDYRIHEGFIEIELAIIAWLVFRYVRLKRYDFTLDAQAISFVNLKKVINWDSVVKVAFYDGYFFLERLPDLSFMDMGEIFKVSIKYESASEEQHIEFYLDDTYYSLTETAKVIVAECRSRGIEPEFVFSRKQNHKRFGVKKA